MLAQHGRGRGGTFHRLCWGRVDTPNRWCVVLCVVVPFCVVLCCVVLCCVVLCCVVLCCVVLSCYSLFCFRCVILCCVLRLLVFPWGGQRGGYFSPPCWACVNTTHEGEGGYFSPLCWPAVLTRLLPPIIYKVSVSLTHNRPRAFFFFPFSTSWPYTQKVCLIFFSACSNTRMPSTKQGPHVFGACLALVPWGLGVARRAMVHVIGWVVVCITVTGGGGL